MIRILFLIIFLPGLIRAQSDFLNDPDIVWAVEIEQDWVLDVPEKEQMAGVTTLKLLCAHPERTFSQPYTLSELVTSSASLLELPIYSDPACTKAISWDKVLGYSGELGFDSLTQEETLTIGCRDFDLDAVKMWRSRQVLAFHRKNARWSTWVESVGALLEVHNEQGDSIDTQAIFWFKPEQKRPDIHSKNIIWAKRTEKRQAAELIPIAPERLLKCQDGYADLRPHLRDLLIKRMEAPLYDAQNDQLLSPPARREMLQTRIDTIYSELEYNEKGTFVVSDVFTELEQLRVMQSWYWDARRHRLSICLDAVAPIRRVLNNEGDLRYMMPLFYRKAKP